MINATPAKRTVFTSVCTLSNETRLAVYYANVNRLKKASK